MGDPNPDQTPDWMKQILHSNQSDNVLGNAHAASLLQQQSDPPFYETIPPQLPVSVAAITAQVPHPLTTVAQANPNQEIQNLINILYPGLNYQVAMGVLQPSGDFTPPNPQLDFSTSSTMLRQLLLAPPKSSPANLPGQSVSELSFLPPPQPADLSTSSLLQQLLLAHMKTSSASPAGQSFPTTPHLPVYNPAEFSGAYDTASFKRLLETRDQGHTQIGPQHQKMVRIETCCGNVHRIPMNQQLEQLLSSRQFKDVITIPGYHQTSCRNMMSDSCQSSSPVSCGRGVTSLEQQTSSTIPDDSSSGAAHPESKKEEPRKRRRHDEVCSYDFSKPTPEFQRSGEWERYRFHRNRYYASKKVPDPLEWGTEEYTQRYSAAVKNSLVALAYKDEKMTSRKFTLFDPDRLGPIPHKVKCCVGAMQCFMDWRGKEIPFAVKKQEWQDIQQNDPVTLKEWVRRGSDLMNEQLKQKYEGWVDPVSKQRRKKNVMREVEKEVDERAIVMKMLAGDYANEVLDDKEDDVMAEEMEDDDIDVMN